MLVSALAHKIPYAFIHRDASRSNQARHASHNAMIARGNHVGCGAKNRDELEHVVVVGSENRNAREFFLNIAASDRVQPLHSDKNWENIMALTKRGERFNKTVDVVPVFFLDFRAGLKKVNCAVLAVLISAGRQAREIFSNRGLHRPNEGMNRT